MLNPTPPRRRFTPSFLFRHHSLVKVLWWIGLFKTAITMSAHGLHSSSCGHSSSS